MAPLSFSFMNNPLSFYFIRSFAHFFVFLSLFAHQLLLKVFIDPDLAIPIYLLCSFIFFVDSFCLFFYKKNSKNLLFDLLLLFLDAVFLSALVIIMGPLGLFFVFILIFIQSIPLFLSEKFFLPFVFLLYFSILLPITFLWEGKSSFEERLFLTAFVNISLFFILGFGWLFGFVLNFIEKQKNSTRDDFLDNYSHLKPPTYLGMSLDLARRLKPILNSLIKYFPENRTDKNERYSVPASFFSPEKGRHQLEQMRKFILNFIEYAEPEIDFLFKDTVDLKKLLTKLLKKLESHAQRPKNLIQTNKLPGNLKIKGSVIHLEQCFKQILINSFEALKNQDKPKIMIKGHLEKSSVNLEFSDNGHGIEPEDIKKLFDPLFSKRFGLRGLGLPYVQKIVKIHNAVMEISSSQKGTVIIIKFPLIYDFYNRTVKKLKQKKSKSAA